MITYVRGGSTGYIHIDGVQIGTNSASFTFASVTRWSIGQEWDDATPSDFYVGAVDDARFFGQAGRHAGLPLQLPNLRLRSRRFLWSHGQILVDSRALFWYVYDWLGMEISGGFGENGGFAVLLVCGQR